VNQLLASELTATIEPRSLLSLLAGDRLGLVPAPQSIPTTLADVRGVFHASVRSPYSPAGGVGWSQPQANIAALGEAVERISAVLCKLESFTETVDCDSYALEDFCLYSSEQLANPECPFKKPAQLHMIRALRLHDQTLVAVPKMLAGLNDADGAGVVTSNGLAAGPTREWAIERALQEVIERDCLTTAWLHSYAPPRIALPQELSARLPYASKVSLVDITPAYSPWPVVAVCGSVPQRGRDRFGLGAACRATYELAIEKAFLEFAQATLYVGVQMQFGTLRSYTSANEVTTFEDHAQFYSALPSEWNAVPFWQGAIQTEPGPKTSSDHANVTTEEAVQALKTFELDVLAIDLTIPEVAHVGVHVYRVLVPGLMSVNADHRWPYLGNRSKDVRFRFPNASSRMFPSPYPHPLG
jgi:ribosomal protein S12 methylthiotransferase accessory factor